MKSLEDSVAELLDREAIRDLPIRYCDATWRNDSRALVEMFTEDGAMIVDKPRPMEIRGKARLRELYETLDANGQPRPFVHNHVVDLTGPDEATGTVYVELRLAGDDMAPWACGYYHDKYRKENGTWKFQERRITLFEQTPRSSSFKL